MSGLVHGDAMQHRPTTSRTTHVARTSLGPRLDREWERLRHHRRALQRVRAWRDDPVLAPHVEGVRDVGAVLRATIGGPARADDADRVLAAIVRRAGHDQLAGRIVLQRILPGLVVRAAKYRWATNGLDPMDVVVAAAWLAIGCYDVDRRPRHVAASLVSDTTFQAFRQPLRRLAASEESRPPRTFVGRVAVAEPREAADELADVLRDAAASGVSEEDVLLLGALGSGGSTRSLAEQSGVTTRTIRNRRTAALGRVRDAIADAA